VDWLEASYQLTAILVSNVDDPTHNEQYMRRALDLAQATIGLASPNPQVGCMLVRDGEIVGQGAHLYDQYDHAEIAALKQAGAQARGATAYVTLEPCSYHGRTGPCADALIAAGVLRVVAATVDPNPQVSGQGIARLRAAGVEVEVGLLQHEARQLNQAFAKFIRTGRPLVTLKAALSADGKLAPSASARTVRQPHWLTGPEARAEVQRMRHAADAVLTGIGTVLADDPALTDRTGLPRRRPLLRVVLDSQLRTPPDSQLVRSANGDVLIFCAPHADPQHAAALETAGVEVECIAGHAGRLDLSAVLDSELNGSFLAQNLVDKVALFHSNTELGEQAVPFATAFGPPSLLEPSLSSVSRKAFGPDTCTAGYLHDPWVGLAQ
jgi:diaminohydroxyphosphoribosylaminopyrimidine deaminase/5-amino-6-(5-phosphoribosylamino)uracil reductase